MTIANLQDLPDTVTALDARVVTLEAAQGNQYSRAWTTASGQKCLFATLRYVA